MKPTKPGAKEPAGSETVLSIAKSVQLPKIRKRGGMQSVTEGQEEQNTVDLSNNKEDEPASTTPGHKQGSATELLTVEPLERLLDNPHDSNSNNWQGDFLPCLRAKVHEIHGDNIESTVSLHTSHTTRFQLGKCSNCSQVLTLSHFIYIQVS